MIHWECVFLCLSKPLTMNCNKSIFFFLFKALPLLTIVFLTSCSKNGPPPSGKLSLTISSISSITGVTATCEGKLISSAKDSILQLGVCWSINPGPTAQSGFGPYNPYLPGTINFSVPLAHLQPSTKYYGRALVTNQSGTITYSNELSFMTASVSVGSSLYDGIVFYLESTGQHGLIAATSDLQQLPWTPVNYSVTSASSSLDGPLNTATIVNQLGITTSYAAEACFLYKYNQLSGDGHIWFLPAKEQLILLYNNKAAVGGFSNTPYWSSTELDSTRAWNLDLSNGVLGVGDKLTAYGVRPIRAF
jgi:hypothetical protein